MKEINIHQAKTHLSRLLARVQAGEEIVISKAGKPVARLVPLDRKAADRVPGMDRGLIAVPDDFNITPAEILLDFEA